jgi:hypothetical protein
VSDTSTDVLDGPESFGQAETDGAPEESGFEASVLDLNELGSQYVTVKINGTEERVPLSEAVAGYQRQADYTRKTQELASKQQELTWSNTLRQALDNDPQGTLNLLATHYGIDRSPPQPSGSKQVAADDDWGDWGDESTADNPTDPRYEQLNQRLAAFEAQEADRRLQADISRLQQKYGDEFNPTEIVGQALQRQTTDLESVFRQLAFERIWSERQSVQQTEAERQRLDEAKTAASIVSGGSSARDIGSNDGPVESIRDAWAAAKRELGVNF